MAQTITFNATNKSAWIFEDSDILTSTADGTTCPDLVITDMNSSNSTIHTGVTVPEDWNWGNYLFDGTTWTIDPNWVEFDPDPSLGLYPEP